MYPTFKVTRFRHSRAIFCVVALALSIAGCKSKQEQAIDQATRQAVATGQPQQVTTTEKNGNVTTTVIQPPAAPGQPPQITTTTQSPGAASAYSNSSAPASGTTTAPLAVRVAAGTRLTIRIDQNISVKHTPAGSGFTGEVVEAVPGDNNQVAIPKGSQIQGVVDASHKRGHFKGASILELRLVAVNINGTSYPIDTHDLTRTKKGKGKRSAAMIGGGAGAGMLVGGIATGGVGLLVGGLVGGGAGTAAAGMTGNRDIDIPAESIVNFRLADPLVIQS
jgi:hypothetical protein